MSGYAIGWEFGRRNRLVLAVLVVYLVGFWAVKLSLLAAASPIRMDPPNGVAALVIAPVTWAFFYFVGMFTYGLSGDLAARQSIFPARMFTLPITTRALAGWPILYGTTATAALWIVTALLLRLASASGTIPLFWPALLGCAYLAWTQALMWMPYGLPGVRVVIAAIWLAVVDTIVLLALHYKARESTMAMLLAPQIPLAYLVAWHAVGRARRGDVPDWSGRLPWSRVERRVRERFTSAARAHVWFEWRQYGRVLPAMAAIVVPVELLLLFMPGNDTAPVVFLILIAALITPPFLAIFAGAAVAAPPTFVAIRPATTASLVAAKLEATLLSTLAAWAIVLVAIPLGLTVSGRMPIVVERAGAAVEIAGPLRAAAVVVLLLCALFASTWKQLVQSLCIGLTGRGWLIKSTVLLALAFLAAVGPIADWIIHDRDVQSAIWNALPWIVVALVSLKGMAGAWVAIRLYHRRLLPDRGLMLGAACWLLTVTALYGVLVWFAASPLISRYFLAAIATLQVPLARVSAAPLALAWNRHR